MTKTIKAIQLILSNNSVILTNSTSYIKSINPTNQNAIKVQIDQ